STAYNLRGLGTDETLVLVNGRRLASINLSGLQQQPDLGGIPLSAVERIEILPSTASGIFGGGATGGVINVVLKQNYRGVDVSSSVENTFRATAPVRKVGFSAGVSSKDGATGLMISGAYSEASQLYAEDRNFGQAARAMLLANNPSALLGAT